MRHLSKILLTFLLPASADVAVELRDGRVEEGRAITLEGESLRVDGRTYPLAEVAALRFLKKDAPPELLRGQWDLLLKIRSAPFASPEFEALKRQPPEALARRASGMARGMAGELDPAKRQRIAERLAAIRFLLDEPEACREALRMAKTLARERQDWPSHDACCARLAALQIPEPGTPFSERIGERVKSELLSDILDSEGRSSLKARWEAVAHLAR